VLQIKIDRTTESRAEYKNTVKNLLLRW